MIECEECGWTGPESEIEKEGPFDSGKGRYCPVCGFKFLGISARAQEQMERAMARVGKYFEKAGEYLTNAAAEMPCVDCGEPIGKPRVKHGFITCIDCQRERER